MIDWKMIGIAGALAGIIVVCLTILAAKGLIPPAVVASVASTVLGLFTGWVQPQPTKTLIPPQPPANGNGGAP